MKELYTLPKLAPKNEDMNREWFIYFRFNSGENGNNKLFKYRGNLNQIESKKDRKKEASLMIQVLNQKLKQGWSPLQEQAAPPEKKSLLIFINEILEGKLSTMKKSSKKTYAKIIGRFIEYLKKNKFNGLYPENFTVYMAHSYMDYLLKEFGYGGKSFNNNLEVLKIFFNALIDRRIITENPFKPVKRMNEMEGKNFPLTDVEKEKLREYFNTHDSDRHFYRACMLTYYCFLRRTELIGLRVEDIHLSKKTIIIHAGVSKNHRQQSVTIPRDLEPILKEMELEKYPGHYFVFGRGMKISETQVSKPDYISCKFRKIADELGIDSRKGFYSHKHSGVCALFELTKDPYLVQHQCRHSDLNITMTYLRSLGLTVSEKIRDVDFSF